MAQIFKNENEALKLMNCFRAEDISELQTVLPIVYETCKQRCVFPFF